MRLKLLQCGYAMNFFAMRSILALTVSRMSSFDSCCASVSIQRIMFWRWSTKPSVVSDILFYWLLFV